ncbi:MAG TPA: hypothetical protein VFC39_05515 [Acidobacteriaceae bacterium]|nr:hypothetical protein [Acidobacteriaceae bacterium]
MLKLQTSAASALPLSSFSELAAIRPKSGDFKIIVSLSRADDECVPNLKGEGKDVMVSKALGWLCEEPEHSFTLNKFFRRGWPGLANFFLLPKQLELGRAARTLERCLFLGGLAAFAVVGGRPALSWGLVVELKVIALIVGFVTQGTLKVAEYLIGGAEKVLPIRGQGNPIDLERYAGRKTE